MRSNTHAYLHTCIRMYIHTIARRIGGSGAGFRLTIAHDFALVQEFALNCAFCHYAITSPDTILSIDRYDGTFCGNVIRMIWGRTLNKGKSTQ